MSSKINPFMQPSPLAKRGLQELLEIARKTYERGWNWGTAGNFSVRFTNPYMWQSPSGFPKAEMPLRAFIPVHIETLTTVRPCAGKPSAETPLHAAVYRRFEDARAVLHVHTPYTVRLSLETDRIVFAKQEMAKVFGALAFYEELTVPMIDNTQEMEALGSRIDQLINPQVPFFVLRGHGVYAWGASSQEALNYIEGLEFLCRTNRP